MASAFAGCATGPDRIAVPAQLSGDAAVPGLADVRVWGDANFSHALLQAELPRLKAKYQARDGAQPKSGTVSAVSNLLALSGGADDGAFGAGLLVGWSEHGDRPEFDLVTGISAGALIAPFAFLGRNHDRELAGLFTSYSADQIYQSNILSGLFGGNALADSAPLARLIDHYVDARFLRSVAEERAKGRFLLVGTTNLDAQRPVYWDMGRIAQKGDEQALNLFRRVLLASASIPGVFPPVLVEVAAGGHLYQEMHVDGGTTREVFFTIADFRFAEIDKAIGRKVQRRLWIIRNGKIEPEYKAMPEMTLAIAQRSLETLTKSRGIGDLVRMYSRARADHIDYNLAAIPADFEAPHPKPFDRAYMQELYDRGLAMGRGGSLGQGPARGHRRGAAVRRWAEIRSTRGIDFGPGRRHDTPMKRNQITMPLELKRRAQAKAAQRGISLAEYLRRIRAADLGLPREGSEPGKAATTGR